jgi:para-nitrobenzyl esterase
MTKGESTGALQHVVVPTRQGDLRGQRIGGIRRFLGVPYAAAPVADLRFRAPQPAPSWPGVRDAISPGPNAPQVVKAFPSLDPAPLVGSGWVRGDDYLALNVWAPDDDGRGRPVMVFVHGGAFAVGSKDASVSDGSGFARSGIVCVAINYRMGIDGFLPIEGVPTNLGLRDQLFALQWVQQNIAAFGGDPANVTVFGESAGAMSVANLIASPLARGLFRRAIIQSGHGSMVRPIAVAQRLTRKVAEILRVTPDVKGFSGCSFEQCADATTKAQLPTTRVDLRDAQGREPAFGLSRFLPVVGDDVLPLHPLEALAQGAGSDVELLIGTNREEMNLYFVPTRIRRWMFRPLAGWLVGRSEPQARAVLRAYGMGAGRRTGDAFTEALHDLVFRLPARRYAQAFRGRVHCYEFEWQSTACDGQLGACHAMELPFVFDTLATVTGPRGIAGLNPPQALAERVHGLWAAFARDGQLPWPEFDDDRHAVYQLARGEWISDPKIPAADIVP